jgi:hypothetical protein
LKWWYAFLPVFNGAATGTCFIQKIYAPSSSLLSKEEEGGIFFQVVRKRKGYIFFWMKQVLIDVLWLRRVGR